MSGFLANIFGQSNQSQQGNVATGNQSPQPGQPGYVPGTQQLQPQNNNNQPQPPATGNTAPNGDPANNADPTKGAPNSSPMDVYKELFTITPVDPNAPSKDPFAEPLLQIDQKKLQEAAQKVNFAANIAPELATKALQGDAASLMAMMNQVAQNAFYAATTSNAQVIESAIGKNNSRYDSALPDRVRSLQVSQAQTKHPALNHPAATPMVEALKAQIAAKNPTLHPDKVAEHAENYFLSLANDISAKDPNKPAPGSPKAGEPDYSIFMN